MKNQSTEHFKKQIGNLVRSNRESRGWTQEQMAQSTSRRGAEISVITIQRIENGEEVSLSQMFQILGAFDLLRDRFWQLLRGGEAPKWQQTNATERRMQ